jgi:tRNA dimethylallyltransferase
MLSMARKTLCAVVGTLFIVQLMSVGSTGVGKSQLGIELAKRFGGQIINGDSMQVYRAGDVLTNKVTSDEMNGVKHHLMSFLEPHEVYSTFEFEKDAMEAVFIDFSKLIAGR